VHSLVILLAAALLCLPCLLVGISDGRDSDTHVQYQYHFSRQFWSGDLYPRWLTGANKGYGTPIFLIQYPLPYFVTAILRPIMPFAHTPAREARELGVFCFLALAASGLSARVWFRQSCSPYAATTAALVYISLPYVLGQSMYQRAALGELCAFIWIPLALALCDGILLTFASVGALAVVLALLIFSNVLSVALFAPLMAGYTIASARLRRLSVTRCLAAMLLAVVMSAGIAAIYLLPLISYRRLFEIGAMPANIPAFELARYFLFVTSGSLPEGWVAVSLAAALCLMLVAARYVWRSVRTPVRRAYLALTLGLGVAMIAPDLGPQLIRLNGLRVSAFDSTSDFSLKMLVTGLSTVALGIVAYCRISGTDKRGRERLLLVAACASFFLMLPWAAPVWKAVPQLAVLQFPFRFCAILTVAAAGLLAAAVDHCLRHRTPCEGRPSPMAVSLVTLTLIGAGILTWGVVRRYTSPSTVQVDVTRGVDKMYRTYVSPKHLEAFAKMLGTTPDSYDVTSTSVQGQVSAECEGSRGTVEVLALRPDAFRVSAKCAAGTRVRIGQLYSPLWRAASTAGSSSGPVLDSSPDGLIEVSLDAGQRDFELVFDTGWPERYGAILTAVSLLVAVGGFAFAGWSGMRKPAPDAR
jgi:hypothetical protein